MEFMDDNKPIPYNLTKFNKTPLLGAVTLTTTGFQVISYIAAFKADFNSALGTYYVLKPLIISILCHL